ncbi:MAG: hypothetical protein JWN60_1057 [Acidobacteria bacterium]|nr:hypothetical protein [Acidobacteriota bacterium]
MTIRKKFAAGAANQARRIERNFKTFAIILLFAQALLLNAQAQTIKFAVIGDFGSGDEHEREVADLVKSWNPDFITTTGDNNYPDGEASTIDKNIGQFYHDYIYPYKGSYGAGAAGVNRFFPTLGNHDWNTPKAQPYLDYFTLPGNERYYDFVRGPLHLFMLDSDVAEPDGITETSVQGQWLRNKLAASTAPWKIVIFHHTPYSSRTSTTKLQWSFQEWGATAVIAGHAHLYERVMRNGFPYFTNGLGGESGGTFGTPIAGSEVRYGEDYGAQLVTASADTITFKFITHTGTLIDAYTISNLQLTAPSALEATAASGTQINLSWTDNASNEDGFKIERCQNSSCTNFVEIAEVLANDTTYSDSGRTPLTTYRYRVRAFNSGGDSAYTNTAQALTGDPPSTVFSDNFNDGTRDATKWNLGIFSRSASYFDPNIVVVEQNGQLSITPRSSTTGNLYGGYLSAATWNLTDAAAEVEAAQKTAGSAVTMFSVGTDKDNWFSFRAKGSSLYLESRKAGVTTDITLSYSAVQHRFWRVRHDPLSDTVAFETSADGNIWTTQWSVARGFAISAVKFELIAGTGGAVAAPGSARFDNFIFENNNSTSAPPAAPGNLLATAFSSSQINLSWTDNSSDEDAFAIERCQNANCTGFTEIAKVGANVTSYSSTGLSANTVYRFRVRASDGGAISDYSNIAQTTTPLPPTLPPDAPTNLTAKAISISQIDLAWSINSDNEDGFKIERCQNATCTNFTEIAQVGFDVGVYSDTGRAAGTLYRYRVRAFNSGGTSAYSNTAEASTLSQTPTLPAAPSNLTATAASSVQINLAWTDNSANEDGFKIERCQNAACTTFAEVAQAAAGTTVYTDSGLTAGTSYQYRVRAYNAGGNSAYSNTASATTMQATQTPLAPNALMASSASATQINLSWTDTAANESGFKIERCQNTGCTNFVQIAQVSADITTYSNTALTTGTLYRYRVRAYNASGDSAYSNIAETTAQNPPATLPAAPSNLAATAQSATQINLTWTDNASNEDGYKIERCQNAACTNFVEIVQTAANINAYNDTGRTANTVYRYRIRAFNSAGSSAYSNTAEETTLTQTPTAPAAPSNLTAASTAAQINLEWTDNATNEDGYKIERCQNAACTNFVEIGQVSSNAIDYSDMNITSNTVYRYRVRAFNAGGNSAYSNTAEANTSAPSGYFSDDFEDSVRDPAKWNQGIFSFASTSQDSLVAVAEQSGQLSITPRASVTGAHYNGYVTAESANMTNALTSIRVSQKAAGNSQTLFSIGIDSSNFYRFRSRGSTIYMESSIGGTLTSTSVSSTSAPRVWRIRHDAAADTIVFETSADEGLTWVVRRTVARQFAITNVKIEIIAGTSESVAAPGMALFDNFRFQSVGTP